MTDLFNRDFRCTIGAALISIQTPNPLSPDTIAPSLRASFRIEKTDSPEPNKATVEVYNLNTANRAILKEGADLVAKAIAAAKKLGVPPSWEWPLVVEAGYTSGISQLFSGDVTFARSVKERVDWITTIEAEDGGPKFANARVNLSFGAGTTLVAILTTLAKEIGLGIGNSVAHFSVPLRKRILFKKGVVLSGKVSEILDTYCATAGYTWSIQDGQLQVLASTETLVEAVVKVSPSTGLVGSPELGEEGVVTFRSLLQGKIRPGKRVILDSKSVKGTFKVQRVTYIGDTWGTDWYSEVEGKPIT
jgi:hypothetical protein